MRVLLVHGMGRTPLSFRRLSGCLGRSGYETERIGYVAALENFASIRERVRRHLERLARTGRRYAVLGHSLGGLVLRAALPAIDPPPAHLIFLATPNRSPRLARRLHRWLPYRLLCGDAGQLLARPEFFLELPRPQVPYTIITGSGGPRGKWSPFGQDLNDRLVAVEETKISPDDRPVVLDVGHTFMMNDERVQAIVVEILGRSSPAGLPE